MSESNKAKTPQSIGNISFRIPLYQRPYAWEEDQVRQLLNDLQNAMTTGEDYHIGILSVAKTADDNNRYDLIDGQQRITTLMLIGKAASKYCPDWKNFLSNSRLQFYGRKGDQAYLDKGDESNCNRLMLLAVKIAEEYFEKSPDLAKYIYHHAAFFLSELPTNYTVLDKNQQFVRYNNRGRQLEKHEILKTRLLYMLKEEAEKESCATIWNSMLNCISGTTNPTEFNSKSLSEILEKGGEVAEGGQGGEPLYTAIVNVPEFLLIALKRYLKNTGKQQISTAYYSTDKLLENFKILTEKDKDVKTKANEVAAFF